MNRKVGSIQWLRDSPPEVFRPFYTQAKSMSGSQIMALCSRQVSTSLVTEVGWAEKGTFLPLSVWKTKGWDAEAIAARATGEDIRVDPTYGWYTYRVNIRSTEEGQKRQTNDNLALLAKGRTRALKRKSTDEVSVKSIKDGAASDDRSFSSESSSSGEDNKPLAAGRKGKKPKAKAKKEDGGKTKVKAAAKAALKKISNPLNALRTTCAHRCVMEAEEEFLDPVRAALRQLSGIEKKCKTAMKDGMETFKAELDVFDFAAAKNNAATLKKKLDKMAKAQ